MKLSLEDLETLTRVANGLAELRAASAALRDGGKFLTHQDAVGLVVDASDEDVGYHQVSFETIAARKLIEQALEVEIAHQERELALRGVEIV